MKSSTPTTLINTPKLFSNQSIGKFLFRFFLLKLITFNKQTIVANILTMKNKNLRARICCFKEERIKILKIIN